MTILELFEPIIRILPEVPKPTRPVSFKEKLIWTGLILTLYFVMSQTPLYPLGSAAIQNVGAQINLLSIIFASKMGTLMQLGIGPIVTAGLIMQLLVGSKIIELDMTDPYERGLFTGTQKFLAILFTAVEAAAYIIGGGGVFRGLTASQGVAVFIQLFIVGILIILFDEILEKGWGFGSAVSLFILAGVAQQIFSGLLNPIPVGDKLPYGVFPALAASLTSGQGLWPVINRIGGWPSLLGLGAMIFVFIFVTYFEGVRIEVPVIYAKYGGYRAKIPLKFLYVSNVPVILASALSANALFFSQVMWNNYNRDNSNPFLNLLFQFKVDDRGNLNPIGGLVYYMLPPRGLSSVLNDPMHALGYTLIISTLSIIFAIAWVETSGMSARAQAENLVKSGMQVPGFRSSVIVLENLLKRYIPTLTWLSGFIVGLLAAVADMLGAIGSGMGILLSVGIINQFYEILMAQRLEEEYPAIARLLGGE